MLVNDLLPFLFTTTSTSASMLKPSSLVQQTEVLALAFVNQVVLLWSTVNLVLVKENKKDWDLKIPEVLFAYKTALHESIEYPPYLVDFGRTPTLPVDIMLV